MGEITYFDGQNFQCCVSDQFMGVCCANNMRQRCLDSARVCFRTWKHAPAVRDAEARPIFRWVQQD
jgi:hypothetical protein